MNKDSLNVAFVGPSGAGKSTCYQLAAPVLEKAGYLVTRCDVAYPLRLIQIFSYGVFGMQPPGDPDAPENFRQDGRLLACLAQSFESHLGPFVESAIRRVENAHPAQSMAFINTDCRNNAYPALEKLGFIFIRLDVTEDVLAQRRRRRGDLTPFDYSAAVEQSNQIKSSYKISNNGSKKELERSVRKVIIQVIKTSGA